MKERFFTYMEERFGLRKELFGGFGFYASGRGRIHIGPKELPVRALSVGLLAARVGKDVKPTSNFLQLFGRHATKNIVELSGDDAFVFAEGGDLEIGTGATNGWVIVKHEGIVLGCGLLSGTHLKNAVQKAKRLKA